MKTDTWKLEDKLESHVQYVSGTVEEINFVKEQVLNIYLLVIIIQNQNGGWVEI